MWSNLVYCPVRVVQSASRSVPTTLRFMQIEYKQILMWMRIWDSFNPTSDWIWSDAHRTTFVLQLMMLRDYIMTSLKLDQYLSWKNYSHTILREILNKILRSRFYLFIFMLQFFFYLFGMTLNVCWTISHEPFI